MQEGYSYADTGLVKNHEGYEVPVTLWKADASLAGVAQRKEFNRLPLVNRLPQLSAIIQGALDRYHASVDTITEEITNEKIREAARWVLHRGGPLLVVGGAAAYSMVACGPIYVHAAESTSINPQIHGSTQFDIYPTLTPTPAVLQSNPPDNPAYLSRLSYSDDNCVVNTVLGENPPTGPGPFHFDQIAHIKVSLDVCSNTSGKGNNQQVITELSKPGEKGYVYDIRPTEGGYEGEVSGYFSTIFHNPADTHNIEDYKQYWSIVTGK